MKETREDRQGKRYERNEGRREKEKVYFTLHKTSVMQV
jgi:hypothetical protein